MTLLISAVSNHFVLSSSDMRISSASGGRIIPVDERFNKHIFFYIAGLKANITYTGLAQWRNSGEKVNLYDIVSESLVRCAKEKLAFGPLSIALTSDINKAIQSAQLKRYRKTIVELHITGYHEKIPYPFVACISNNRSSKPWGKTSKYEWHHNVNMFNIFIKFAEYPDIMIGGTTDAVTVHERELLLKVIKAGANAFNVSNLSSKLIEMASKRSLAVGKRSVTTLIPSQGFLDIRLWDRTDRGIVGYMPRMIFPNGTIWGPSEFPVDLRLILKGHIPSNNIFFRSIIYKSYKRSIRRRIFRYKRGDKVPGIMGFLCLCMFGKLPDGYIDFGLSNEHSS